MIYFETVTYSPEETEAVAKGYAEKLGTHVLIALFGDLGAGKTVFSRGFARGLGITEPISSPTFTIVQEYNVAPNEYFFHLDLYRIDDSDVAFAFGIDEFLDISSASTLIEWPERIDDILPDDTIAIYIEQLDENSRRITAKKWGE
jgi:tRNA threonylcarbamoyladenosine biosynthesis protein TsaE